MQAAVIRCWIGLLCGFAASASKAVLEMYLKQADTQQRPAKGVPVVLHAQPMLRFGDCAALSRCSSFESDALVAQTFFCGLSKALCLLCVFVSLCMLSSLGVDLQRPTTCAPPRPARAHVCDLFGLLAGARV